MTILKMAHLTFCKALPAGMRGYGTSTGLAGMTLKADVADPMSGFFITTRDFFYRVQRHATGLGFKILLDLIASAERPVRVAEVPFVFRLRQAGESKLDTLVAWEYFV